MASLRALLINCSLKPKGGKSSTDAMLQKVVDVLRSHGVVCKKVWAADASIQFGTEASMGRGDGWPQIREQILESDIIVIGCPIWMGQRSSVCQMVLERMDAFLYETNDAGQLLLYNKVGGACVVGNEDGAQHSAASIVYNLMQLGVTIPPQCEAYWVGLAGGKDDFVDVALDDEYVATLAIGMGSNLFHFATMLKANPIPADGNVSEE